MVKFLEVHKSVLTLCLMIWFGTNVFSQSTTPIDTTTEIVTYVEIMPEFPGGQAALIQYLSNNIKYPEECRKMGVEGKVFVKFIVDPSGNITNVQVLRGVVDGKLLEKEAVRVVESMPKWKPGTQGGKAVNVYFTLPISFKLSTVSEEKK